MNYDVNYFIKKFSKIPEELWGVDFFYKNGTSCAIGHCGIRKEYASEKTEESESLIKLFNATINYCVTSVNDGCCLKYKQPTPKQRILAALYDIKAKQEKKLGHDDQENVRVPEPEYIVVTMDTKTRELAKENFELKSN